MQEEKGNLWAVLLAAGCSKRMGDFKPLLPFGETTIIEHGIECFQKAGITNIMVVTGHKREALSPVLNNTGVYQIHNYEYEKSDMLCSLKAGVEAVFQKETPRGVLISPGDIPCIHPFTILQVIKAWEEGGKQIVIPQYNEKDGHPPLLGTEALLALLDYNGSMGLGGFLKSREDVFVLPVPDDLMMRDADTREDYENLREAYRTWEIPDETTCEALWDYAHTPENVRRHCRCVAERCTLPGERILPALPKEQRELFQRALLAGGFLHDVMRPEPGHHTAGAQFLNRLGYAKTARVVQAHKNLLKDALFAELDFARTAQDEFCGEILPAFLVYMGDRLVEETVPCTYEDKYEIRRRRFAGNPQALEKLEKDRQRFLTCRKLFKGWMGYDLFE